MNARQKMVDKYEADNETAALLILADIRKHGGEQAGLVQWARLVLEKREAADRGWRLVA